MNKNTLLLWQGQLVSQLGAQAYVVAMMLWLMEYTGSAGLMSMIMMCAMVPYIVIGPFAGVFADNLPRIRIIMISDIVRGLSVLLMAAVLWYPPGNQTVIIAGFVLVALIGWLSLLLMLMVGMCIGAFNVQAMTLFQTTPPSALRGRVMSFVASATGEALPLGLLVSGQL
ncbi:MAG: DHA3 family macrolide efflux protein-like MFS transporter [Phenylobacterium sp.]|jgi:DHA3 family macrolide efflux protein-like MFS transporter